MLVNTMQPQCDAVIPRPGYLQSFENFENILDSESRNYTYSEFRNHTTRTPEGFCADSPKLMCASTPASTASHRPPEDWLTAISDHSATDVGSLQIGSGNIRVHPLHALWESLASVPQKRSHRFDCTQTEDFRDPPGRPSAKIGRTQDPFPWSSRARTHGDSSSRACPTPSDPGPAGEHDRAAAGHRRRPAAQGGVEELSLGPGNPYA